MIELEYAVGPARHPRQREACTTQGKANPAGNDSVTPTFRFAPSPNGHLHLGHALSALLNFDMARASGGRFLLRIEDIDLTRARREFEEAIYEDLAWLGIAWETPVRRQSEHFDEYRAALDRLEAARPDLSELREPRGDPVAPARARQRLAERS